jgi:hypothetical protein
MEQNDTMACKQLDLQDLWKPLARINPTHSKPIGRVWCVRVRDRETDRERVWERDESGVITRSKKLPHLR